MDIRKLLMLIVRKKWITIARKKRNEKEGRKKSAEKEVIDFLTSPQKKLRAFCLSKFSPLVKHPL